MLSRCQFKVCSFHKHQSGHLVGVIAAEEIKEASKVGLYGRLAYFIIYTSIVLAGAVVLSEEVSVVRCASHFKLAHSLP